MYPISFISDSLRNDIRRFDITIEASTQGSFELTRSVDRALTVEAKISKYIKASLVVLGLGLLSVAEQKLFGGYVRRAGVSKLRPSFWHRSPDAHFS